MTDLDARVPQLATTAARVPDLGRDLTWQLLQSALGDEVAFAAVYDATAVDAYRLALLVVGNPADAETSTVEAYRRVWTESARFDSTLSSATAWILSIVHRESRTRVA